MARAHPRPFTRSDFAILVVSAVLGLILAWMTDQEYRETFGSSPAYSGGATRLPVWVKERRHDAIRAVYGSASALSGWGLGLALATFRPRRGAPRRGRRLGLGLGYITSAVAAVAVLAVAGSWGIKHLWPNPAGPIGMIPIGGFPFLDFYHLWSRWLPIIPWAILGAWFCLLCSGRRRPVDLADRLGRWLGWGWIALIPGQGLIFVLAWS